MAEERKEGRRIFGVRPILLLFAAEYVMQGIANPFQAMTYQPFFKHFHVHYGLDEAATQGLFARSYLAWSFKPVIGFVVDALGKTKLILLALLGTATFSSRCPGCSTADRWSSSGRCSRWRSCSRARTSSSIARPWSRATRRLERPASRRRRRWGSTRRSADRHLRERHVRAPRGGLGCR